MSSTCVRTICGPAHARELVVYTAIFGDYDDLIDPAFIDPDVKYVCFTDQQSITSRVWDVRYVEAPHASPNVSNRRAKILAHEFLPQYALSIYVDGNIELAGALAPLAHRYLATHLIAAPRHPERSSIVEEAEACVRLGKVGAEATHSQLETYRSQGFPFHTPITENSVLLRRHNHPAVIRLMEAWWQEFLASATKRDQLSLPFIVWVEDVPMAFMREHVRGNSVFRQVPHKSHGLRHAWHIVKKRRTDNLVCALSFRVGRALLGWARRLHGLFSTIARCVITKFRALK